MALTTQSRSGTHDAMPAAAAPRPPAQPAAATPPRRRLRAFLPSLYAAPVQFWVQVVVAAVVLAYALSTVIVPRPPSGYSSVWDGWIGNVASLLPLIPIGMRIASTRRLRAAWVVMGSGIALYNVGNLIYLFHDQSLSPIPNPAPSDAAYLLSYLCLVAGVVMLTQANYRSVSASARLDGVITGLAVGSAAGALWFEHLFSVSGSLPQVLVGMAYPLLDLVMLVVLASALAPLHYRPNRSTAMLMIGLAIFAVGDVIYLNQQAAGTYVQGTLLDATWVVGIWCMGLAAWPREERRSAPRRTTDVQEGITVVPIVFGGLSVAVLALTEVLRAPKAATLLALGALALVIVRMAMTLREVRHAEQTNFTFARIDELTGLSNRRAFFESGEERFATRAPGQRIGVVVMDLDGFKEINDTLGHAAGDDLLRIVARRFSRRSDGRGEVARVGGDEFAGTFEIDSVSEIVSIAQELAAMFTDPIAIDGMTVRVGGSVGVALCPDHGLTQAELLRCADIAMYEAKGDHAAVRLYRPEDDLHTRDRLTLLDDLRRTQWERELTMHFQPTLDLSTGAIVGVEALVRWRHPAFGLLYPDDFVPLCERSGLITSLTRTVIEQAVAELARLDRLGYVLGMATNISRVDLLDDALPEYVDVVLARHGIPADRLTLEVTETSLSEDPARVTESIVRLRSRGVRVSIDDFGVGYSSLSQLLELPVDELKIDKTFVLALAVDARARAVVTATVELARALRLNVVAEGIESDGALRAVTELGVDVAQGYFVACPFTSAQLDDFLAAPTTRTRTGDVLVARWPD